MGHTPPVPAGSPGDKQSRVDTCGVRGQRTPIRTQGSPPSYFIPPTTYPLAPNIAFRLETNNNTLKTCLSLEMFLKLCVLYSPVGIRQ